MTKEELIKLSRENLRKSKQGSLCECYDEAFIKGYELSKKRIAELEKENAELERKLEQTEKDLADYQFNYPTIKELQKENAELKEKYAKNITDCDICDTYCNSQLTKAKEIIKAFLDSSDLNIKHKAEEFLGEF